MEDDQKKKRGRPRKYAKEGDRQKAWKERSGFEASESRRAYKAAKAKEYRLKKKQQDNENNSC